MPQYRTNAGLSGVIVHPPPCDPGQPPAAPHSRLDFIVTGLLCREGNSLALNVDPSVSLGADYTEAWGEAHPGEPTSSSRMRILFDAYGGSLIKV